MSTDLLSKKCVPCEGGVEPLTESQALDYLKLVPGWVLATNIKSISQDLSFKDFKQTIAFINQLAELAESEGHHPDFTLHNWNKLNITLSTHAINGLSINDFILAAKINQLL
ncbi:4a-hydroxytetrahydrobiopterin dehydratase [Patescibacteria group bacterium]|nr:4a-hydroxytetrahydrobiopterin dehydratase [Patescibacteria group bacterium]